MTDLFSRLSALESLVANLAENQRAHTDRIVALERNRVPIVNPVVQMPSQSQDPDPAEEKCSCGEALELRRQLDELRTVVREAYTLNTNRAQLREHAWRWLDLIKEKLEQ